MKVGTHNHVKMKRLKRLLGVPLYRAVGILECLWLLCTECCDEGDIGKFSDEEIADYLEWDGCVSQLVPALSASGWIDADVSHRLVVHDWLDHCPDFIRERVRKRRMREGKKHKIRTYDRNGRDSSGQRRTKADKPPHVPSLPIQSNSIPSLPSAENPEGREGGTFVADWNRVADRLGGLKIHRWQQVVACLKENDCLPEHALAVIDYGVANGKEPKQIAHRLKLARNTLPVSEAWPGTKPAKKPPEPKSETEAQADLRFKIQWEGKQAKKSQTEINSELIAAGITP